LFDKFSGRCVIAILLFARSTEKREVPYEAVLYAKKR
jgi:hypothetical protein